MLGIYFYLQIAFAVFLLWATSAGLYMGVFHAHRGTVALGRKSLAAVVSVLLSVVVWFFLYSWTYLSW